MVISKLASYNIFVTAVWCLWYNYIYIYIYNKVICGILSSRTRATICGKVIPYVDISVHDMELPYTLVMASQQE